MNRELIEYPYFDMYMTDGSGVSFERWSDLRSIGIHKHGYYELLMIDRGSCRHIYNNTETLLIPGDAVLIPAHKEHGFSLRGTCSVYNCQFFLSALDENIMNVLQNDKYLLSGSEEISKDKILTVSRENYLQEHELGDFGYEINSSKQGVVHLSPMEYSFILPVLRRSIEAAKGLEEHSAIIKQKYLEVILLELKHALSRQNQKYSVRSKANQRVIADVLLQIEADLTDAIDFNKVAKKYAFSPNYFRKIFKDITGLSPVSYINRLRIIRACENMQKNGVNIKDAAEDVGIYDSNYFSRLFKKIIGCSPSKIL